MTNYQKKYLKYKKKYLQLKQLGGGVSNNDEIQMPHKLTYKQLENENKKLELEKLLKTNWRELQNFHPYRSQRAKDNYGKTKIETLATHLREMIKEYEEYEENKTNSSIDLEKILKDLKSILIDNLKYFLVNLYKYILKNPKYKKKMLESFGHAVGAAPGGWAARLNPFTYAAEESFLPQESEWDPRQLFEERLWMLYFGDNISWMNRVQLGWEGDPRRVRIEEREVDNEEVKKVALKYLRNEAVSASATPPPQAIRQARAQFLRMDIIENDCYIHNLEDSVVLETGLKQTEYIVNEFLRITDTGAEEALAKDMKDFKEREKNIIEIVEIFRDIIKLDLHT